MLRAPAGAHGTAEEPTALLTLALSRPQDAVVKAQAVLASDPDPYRASIAHQAIAIVLRDRGDVAAAITVLRTALRLARRSGNAPREADVRATLGVALAWTGRTRQGLDLLDLAVTQTVGAHRAQVLMRRGSVLRTLGRYDEALQDLNRSLTALRRAGDAVWEARTLTHRAMTHLALGNTARASADFEAAEKLSASSNQELEYVIARHNLGLTAIVRGDLPEALAAFDEARRRYDTLGSIQPDLAIDRCAALLAAGLAHEAMTEADAGAAALQRKGSDAAKRAELLLAAATAALAAGDSGAAGERAERARRAFASQDRPLWRTRAEFVLVQARFESGQDTLALYERAYEIAERFARLQPARAAESHLLAGRIARRRRLFSDAGRHFDAAGRARRRGSALTRSVAWLASALNAEMRGDARATLLACRRGLDALDEHRMTLGATELRAHATAHGTELAQISLRHLLRHGSPSRLLMWSERCRATSLGVRPSGGQHDPELVGALAALRAVKMRLDASASSGTPAAALEREQLRLEAVVRTRTRMSRGNGKTAEKVLRLDELFTALEDTRLVELVEIDGVLHALTVAGSRVRRHEVGPLPLNDVESARAVLTQLATGMLPRHATTMLDQIGRRLERQLLGSAVKDFGNAPVIIVPPGRLHAVPWALLPSLRNREHSVIPSAATWLRALSTRTPKQKNVTLVVGPNLGTGGAEVPMLAMHYPNARVLGHGTATAEETLAHLDGAWLAHIAAHGTFRADNPLFSALHLDDGPLTVHDLERLKRAPYRVVLSACDSGVALPVGADELLGFVSSLIPLGAAGIVAAVVPVHDVASVDVMLALHERLRAGDRLPEALRVARAAVGDDLVASATADSFIALGV